MLVTRRNALRLAAGGLGLTTAVASGFPEALTIKSSSAQELGVPGKTLIKIFMRGGIDGLYWVAPYGDPAYRDRRPTVAVDAPDDTNPNSAIDLDGYFGFNPNLLPLMDIWDAGDLAIFPAAHYQDASRSHFDSQQWIEQGVIGSSSIGGYLNRFVFETPGSSPFRALGAGGSDVPFSLQGAATVPSIRDVDDFSLEDWRWCSGDGCADNRLTNTMLELYSQSNETPIQQLMSAQGVKLLGILDQIKEIDEEYETDAGGLDYSNSSLGRGLRLLAQAIKADLGVQVAAIDWGGPWDSHSNQVNFGYHNSMRQGAEDLLTFYTDMGNRMDDIIIAIGSEFGRTTQQNGSAGTDHGNGTTWYTIGKKVQGGIYGEWPGVAIEQLYGGRFLEMSTNYKDILAEVMFKHLGMDSSTLAAVFPDHSFTDPGSVSA